MSYLADIGRWSGEAAAVRRRTRSLKAALTHRGRLGVVAEFKRASPSQGPIAPHTDPVEVAAAYVEGGAAAMSVLCCEKDFDGSLLDLARVRRAQPDLCLLAKDFTVDPWQITEYRAHGADVVLIILALVDDMKARSLSEAATELGMETLVEVHDEADLNRAVGLGFPVIGVNARNLATLQIDLEEQRRLVGLVPPDRLAVAESGITSVVEARRAMAAGAKGVLVGTGCMQRPELLAELVDVGMEPS